MFEKTRKTFKNAKAVVKTVINTVTIPIKNSVKRTKFWIDDNFREKVIPVEGSVLYSDLLVGAEHSGIYIGNSEISNIVVENLLKGDSKVKVSNPESFADKGKLHKKIYVSCNKNGSVGSKLVSNKAISHIGDKNKYGLFFNNCHQFSEKCVDASIENYNLRNILEVKDIDETWESTIKDLKKKAKKKIGATKWKLWDWNNNENQNQEKAEKPNEQEMRDSFENLELNEETIKQILNERMETEDYQEEISDENIPQEALKLLENFRVVLSNIENTYKENEIFIKLMGGGYSYNDFKDLKEDFKSLGYELKNNANISKLVEKLGRNYISEEKKKRPKIDKRMQSEVFGIHKSNDLLRILPSEMINMEDEDLEVLFYSRYLENNLLTYQLRGNGIEEYTEEKNERKGPVVALLDTSGSMDGIPILKAKALLLAVSKILKKENRSLHIILFGDTNQIQELNILKEEEHKKILKFLSKGYGGGTNFETPLKRGIEIIKEKKDYHKADILLITDGLCGISDNFQKNLIDNKEKFDFSVYTVICGGKVEKDGFSDEVMKI